MSEAGPAPVAQTVSPKRRAIVRGLRETAAIIFWIYFPLKVFVFDLDAFVLSHVYPQAIVVTEFRFFLFFGFLLLWWFLVGTKSFITDLAYVILYPLVLVCWHLPRRYLRNWTRAFALLFAVVSTFKAMRTRLAFLFVALAAGTMILISRRPLLLVPSMAILVVFLGYHLVRQFRTAFGPSTLLRGITDLLGRQWQTWGDRVMKSNTTELEKYPRESEDYRKKRFEQLQLLFLLALGFGIAELRDPHFLLVGCVKYLFEAGLVFLLLAAGTGLGCTVARLQDFRITAQIAHLRDDNRNERSVEEMRDRTRWLGRVTWVLFWSQVGCFVTGVVVLGVSIILVHRNRLV